MPLKKTLGDLAAEARDSGVPELDVDEMIELTASDPSAIILDVREPAERARGYVPNSVGLPRGILERDIEKTAIGGPATDKDMDRKIICYCGGGSRSILAVDTLRKMGFTNAMSLEGGFKAWGNSGRPVDLDRSEVSA